MINENDKKLIRGWIGLLIFGAGIVMVIFDITRPYSFFAFGFGAGMMSSGFQ